MRLLACFASHNGEIRVLEEIRTGARVYEEGGVMQSYVRPFGAAGLTYVSVMTALLSASSHVLLLGCGGGTLASELHKRGCALTVVDNNPLSFEIARTFFWMPTGICCVTADMLQFLSGNAEIYNGIGVDVGGPCFDYDAALNAVVCKELARRLDIHGCITINIASGMGADIDTIVSHLVRAGLEVIVLDKEQGPDRNIVLLCMHPLHPATYVRSSSGLRNPTGNIAQAAE